MAVAKHVSSQAPCLRRFSPRQQELHWQLHFSAAAPLGAPAPASGIQCPGSKIPVCLTRSSTKRPGSCSPAQQGLVPHLLAMAESTPSCRDPTQSSLHQGSSRRGELHPKKGLLHQTTALCPRSHKDLVFPHPSRPRQRPSPLPHPAHTATPQNQKASGFSISPQINDCSTMKTTSTSDLSIQSLYSLILFQ